MRQVPKDLKALHAELQTLQWIGADKGWDAAIDAVSARIALMLATPAPSPDAGEGATQDQLETLADIFSTTERLDKLSLLLDPVTRDVVVTYRHLDSEWFKELLLAASPAPGDSK